MTRSLFGFEWRIPRNGYVVEKLSVAGEKAGDGQESVILLLWDGIDQQRCDPDRDYISYNPLEHRTLFRKFSELDGSEKSIILFANKYGRLGGPIESRHGGLLSDGRCALEGTEALADWQVEIEWTKSILDLWDAFNRKHIWRVQSQLEDMKMQLIDGRMSGFSWGPESPTAIETLRKIRAETNSADFKKDSYACAKFCLWDSVNTRLSELTTPEMNWDPAAGTFTLQVTPKSLLGVIWLQIAMAMTGDVSSRQCEACGEWFDVRPDTARSDKRFCGNACRNKLYRDRKKQAI